MSESQEGIVLEHSCRLAAYVKRHRIDSSRSHVSTSFFSLYIVDKNGMIPTSFDNCALYLAGCKSKSK
jgi:hypothetical protein